MKLYLYYHFRPFTNDEAWTLFKLAAFAEAIGWTLLIIGILAKRYLTGGNDWPVLLAGRIHGTLFIVYIMATLILAPSLGWSWFRIVLAGLCSVPPYGSLIFEQLVQKRRDISSLRQLRTLTCYRLATMT